MKNRETRNMSITPEEYEDYRLISSRGSFHPLVDAAEPNPVTPADGTYPTFSEAKNFIAKSPFDGVEAKKFFDFFLAKMMESRLAGSILQAKKYNNPATVDNFGASVFEYLSYIYLREKIDPSRRLLSPIQTDHVYKSGHHGELTPSGIILKVTEDGTYIEGLASYARTGGSRESRNKRKKYIGKQHLSSFDPEQEGNSLFNQMKNDLQTLFPDLPLFKGPVKDKPFNVFTELRKNKDYSNSPSDGMVIPVPINPDALKQFSQTLVNYYDSTH